MNIKGLLKEFGDNIKIFKFKGTMIVKGNVGFPHIDSTYDTVSGTLERFTPGESRVGDYVMVYKRYIEGDAFVEDRYTAIYAKSCINDEVKRYLEGN